MDTKTGKQIVLFADGTFSFDTSKIDSVPAGDAILIIAPQNRIEQLNDGLIADDEFYNAVASEGLIPSKL